MKLRNKKTGDVREFESLNLIVRAEEPEDGYESWDDYHSLAELNEEWEDYKPKEPLIKDEKICKAVRAWAEANGLNYVNCYESAHGWYLRGFNSREQSVDIYFWGYQLPKGLTDCQTYTIAELCGEEEE